MKRVILASVGVLAMFATVGVAGAADLPRREAMPAKAPPYIAQTYNWSGAYVGINGGGGFGRSDFGGLGTGSFDLSGGLVGGTLGYNWQMSPIVFGIEGDIDWSSIRGSTPCGVTSCETRNNWLGTVRGRLGYAADRFMPYITGGAAFGDIKTSVAGIGDSSTTRAGYTVGAGIEAAIAGPWTAKIEYLYVDLGHSSTALGTDASFRTHIVRAGLNYRF